jgi:ketosteroid isomerase-like protein
MSETTQRDDERKAIVRHALECLGRGDTSGMADAVADDVEYQLTGSHPLAATHQGKETFLGLVSGLLSQFDGGIDYTFHRLLAADDTIVATFRGTGKTAHGKTYDNDYCALWDFNSDSKVSRITEFFDSHHVVAALL